MTQNKSLVPRPVPPDFIEICLQDKHRDRKHNLFDRRLDYYLDYFLSIFWMINRIETDSVTADRHATKVLKVCLKPL